MYKKIMSIFMVALTFISIFSIYANAGSRSASSSDNYSVDTNIGWVGGTSSAPYNPKVNTASVSYTNSWELYAFHKDEVENDVVIRFGFDTFVTDEDYCYTLHKSKAHIAVVMHNGGAEDASTQKAKGQWTGKAELEHAIPVLWLIRY